MQESNDRKCEKKGSVHRGRRQGSSSESGKHMSEPDLADQRLIRVSEQGFQGVQPLASCVQPKAWAPYAPCCLLLDAPTVRHAMHSKYRHNTDGRGHARCRCHAGPNCRRCATLSDQDQPLRQRLRERRAAVGHLFNDSQGQRRGVTAEGVTTASRPT